MRKRTPDDLDVQGARDGEVVDEARFAGEQDRVFATQLTGTDDGHRPPPAAASTAVTMFW